MNNIDQFIKTQNSISSNASIMHLNGKLNQYRSSSFALEVISFFCFLIFILGAFLLPVKGGDSLSERDKVIATVTEFLSYTSTGKFNESAQYILKNNEDVEDQFLKFYNTYSSSTTAPTKKDFSIEKRYDYFLCYVKATPDSNSNNPDAFRPIIYEIKLNFSYKIIYISKYYEIANNNKIGPSLSSYR